MPPNDSGAGKGRKGYQVYMDAQVEYNRSDESARIGGRRLWKDIFVAYETVERETDETATRVVTETYGLK